MGARGLAWLSDLELPARLVDVEGAVHYAGGWSA
jgi:hypothetical protein